MNDTITVNAPISFRRWQTPHLAVPASPPRPRQEGFNSIPGVPVAELPQEALDELAAAWLTELYQKAEKDSPWRRGP